MSMRDSQTSSSERLVYVYTIDTPSAWIPGITQTYVDYCSLHFAAKLVIVLHVTSREREHVVALSRKLPAVASHCCGRTGSQPLPPSMAGPSNKKEQKKDNPQAKTTWTITKALLIELTRARRRGRCWPLERPRSTPREALLIHWSSMPASWPQAPALLLSAQKQTECGK